MAAGAWGAREGTARPARLLAAALVCIAPALAAARCGGDAPRTPEGPFTLRVERRGGAEVVRNGTTPLYRDGAVRAEPVWRWHEPRATGYRDLGLGPDSIYMVTGETRSLVSMPRRGGEPRVLASGLYGAHDTGWGQGGAWVVDDADGPILRWMRRPGHPAESVPLGAHHASAGPLALTDSGLVVRTNDPSSEPGWALLRAGGEMRALPLPASPDTGVGLRTCAGMTPAGAGIAMFACTRPLFRHYTLDGTLRREVVIDRWTAPADGPDFRFLFHARDPATGIYALAERQGDEYEPGPTVVHLFSPDGVYLGRIRHVEAVGGLALDHGELYVLTGDDRGSSTVSRFALRLPPGALDSAHAAYLRAGGGR